MLTPPTLLALAQRNRRRRERKERATRGPWISEIPGHNDAHMCRFHTTHEPGFYLQLGCTWHPEILVSYVSLERAECAANATFIAEARNDPVEDDIDLLLAEVRRLRGEETDGKALQERR
jgi:hypothetical protein